MKKLSQVRTANRKNSAGQLQSKTDRFRRIHTGPFVWTEAAHNRASEAGRFVILRYNAQQHEEQLARPDHHLPFRDFLRLATKEQLRAIAGAVPLSTTRFEPDESGAVAPSVITFLRGPAPGGQVYAWMKRDRRRP